MDTTRIPHCFSGYRTLPLREERRDSGGVPRSHSQIRWIPSGYRTLFLSSTHRYYSSLPITITHRYSSLLLIATTHHYYSSLLPIASATALPETLGTVTRPHLEATRMALDVVWRLDCVDEQVLGKRCGEHVYGQGRERLVGSAPPSLWQTGDTDGAEDGCLDRVEATWLIAVFGVTLESSLKPDGLSIGAQTHHDSSHTPRSFALCVCTRTGAVVVVLVQSAYQVIGLACVWSGPVVGCEDVAAKSLTQRHVFRVAGRHET
jgi:hypothetical protein